MSNLLFAAVRRPRVAWLAAVATLGLLAGPAQAQLRNGFGSGPNENSGGLRANELRNRQGPAPSALPGSRLPGDITPTPRDQSTADMAPNDALFDAINRGDTVAARDALSRGADVNAHNVLGMSPLDLSIDLGRNDLTFLLMSLRGDGGGSGPPAPAAATAAAEPGKRVAAAKPPPRQAPQRTARATPIIPPAPPAAPRQFAGDGGAPAPQAGFLGFGANPVRQQ